MAKETPVKTKGSKGKGLTKKVGPFPIFVYLIGVALVIFYFYYRNRSNSGSIAGSLNQQTIPSGVVIPSSNSGATPTSTNENQGGSDSTLNFPTDYATQTDLQNAIDTIGNRTAGDIASITFPTPTLNITTPPPVVNNYTTQTKSAAKKAVPPPAKIEYQTYKTKVKLKAGQTLHFAKGKGYYAA